MECKRCKRQRQVTAKAQPYSPFVSSPGNTWFLLVLRLNMELNDHHSSFEEVKAIPAALWKITNGDF
jgi:hypothetical protein